MELVEALGERYSIEILGAADEPISASELSDSLEIPPATCYRRVKRLASVGLLEECNPECDETSRATLYRRTSDLIGIQFGRNPSVLTWEYVARLSGVSQPTDGGSTERGDVDRTVLALVTDSDAEDAVVEGPHAGERGSAAAAEGEASD